MRANILVVEDDPTIAIDIALNLEHSGYHIIGPTHRADLALKLLEEEHIDLAILDINIEGDQSGIELAQEINQRFGIPFIFLTSYSDKKTVEEAAQTLPSTFIVKPFKETDLAPAVQIALANAQLNRTPNIPTKVRIDKTLIRPLTPAEYEILQLIHDGMNVQEIAAHRFNSENTIKTHIKHIYSKLNVSNRTDLLSKIYAI